MGWYGQEKQNNLSTRDYLISQINSRNDKVSHEVVDIVVKGFSAAYAAVRYKKFETGESHIYGLVMLLRHRDGWIDYKPMDETMGPYYYDCPARILDLLSLTDDKQAMGWRSECRARLERKEVLKQELAAAKEGSIFIFEKPVEFTKGGKHKQMTYHHKDGRKHIFIVGSFAMYASFEKLLDIKTRYGLEVTVQ